MTTYAAVAPVSGLASGDKYAFFVPPAGDINLLTNAFGTGKPCRRIIALDGGVIYFVRPDGNKVHSPVLLVGAVLDIQAQAIEGTTAGTTATKVLVIW